MLRAMDRLRMCWLIVVSKDMNHATKFPRTLCYFSRFLHGAVVEYNRWSNMVQIFSRYCRWRLFENISLMFFFRRMTFNVVKENTLITFSHIHSIHQKFYLFNSSYNRILNTISICQTFFLSTIKIIFLNK